jgi:hypothetical protein
MVLTYDTVYLSTDAYIYLLANNFDKNFGMVILGAFLEIKIIPRLR